MMLNDPAVEGYGGSDLEPSFPPVFLHGNFDLDRPDGPNGPGGSERTLHLRIPNLFGSSSERNSNAFASLEASSASGSDLSGVSGVSNASGGAGIRESRLSFVLQYSYRPKPASPPSGLDGNYRLVDPWPDVSTKTSPALLADYIEYDYLHSCLLLHFQDQVVREKASTINAWLDARCLQAGSSLQGRKEAAAFYLSARKFLPILVSLSPLEVWVPLLPQKDPKRIYCSLANILSLEPSGDAQKNRCRIRFRDGLLLEGLERKRTERILVQAYKFILMLYSSQSSQYASDMLLS
ncbi:competence protein ComK [Allobaculum fili]|nr:competence protein ComK [Allobaculum fili]